MAHVPDGRCNECGVVRSIREIRKRRDAPLYALANPGSVAGFDSRAVGALVVLPFAKRASDNDASAGASGTPEMNSRFAEVSYDITLRMDDGSYRTLERRDGGLFSTGDRVRVSEGRLEMLESP
jgi:outer membrane lipoprotein SlyB